MRRHVFAGTALSLTASLFLGQTLTRAIYPDPVFEAYSPCKKLEVIESDGKPVAGYLYDSGYEQFESAIATTCPQYQPALEEAKALVGAIGPLDFCAGLDIDASQYLEKEDFRDLAYYIYDVCPGSLGQLSAAWDEAKAQAPDLEFDILHPCDKLERKAGLEELEAGWVVNSGLNEFDDAILTYCPNYLGILDEALAVSDDQGDDRQGDDESDEPIATGPLDADFENRPACEKLEIIAADPNKDLIDYIRQSGVEDFQADVTLNCSAEFQDDLDAAAQ